MIKCVMIGSRSMHLAIFKEQVVLCRKISLAHCARLRQRGEMSVILFYLILPSLYVMVMMMIVKRV
jgi:hypothetical protein